MVAPYFFSKARTLADETKSPTDRFAIGLIGAGGMGMGNMNAAKQWVDVVAIADVDAGRAAQANQKLSAGKAAVYDDYRRILERKDIDVLHIATPDHWHTKTLVEAMLVGKDVYCEKPLTLTIDEGKLTQVPQRSDKNALGSDFPELGCGVSRFAMAMRLDTGEFFVA
jgi:predicted homoserine dehydrogenase-like protein